MLVTQAALYARVSTDRQAEAQTIGSQLAALRERAAADGLVIAPALEFVDEGYSGATLVRPALERLRDVVAVGGIEVLYVHGPDRLARRYAHQVLLLDEFARAGVAVAFLNRAGPRTPEDELLVQVQGVIAEYERAQIMERSRRGRRHAARLGSLSVLAHAPYGYRYAGKQHGADPPRYEVVLDEARVVRQVFEWVGRDRLSLGGAARRLSALGVPTRTGQPRWHRATIWDMLKNPAYKGAAAYGRTRAGPWQPRGLRPQRGKSAQPRRAVTMQPVPPEEWLTLAVPPLVDAALFDAVQEQLRENQHRARERVAGARYLLQGLLVCGRCGYAFSGMRTVYRTRAGEERARCYYRCPGTDAYRFGGERVCTNPPVLLEALDAAVWAEVRALLQDPARVEREYTRRWDTLRAAGPQAEADRRATAAQLAKLRQGLARLIDSYTEGLILKAEFEPRLGRLRQRIAALEAHAQQDAAAAATRQDLVLLVGHLDEFAAKVRDGLADADWQLRREIIRALVKRVELTPERVNVVFRVGPGPLRPAPPTEPLHDCRPRLDVATGKGRVRDSAGRLRHSIRVARA
jgi:site-specific DNA recombinase